MTGRSLYSMSDADLHRPGWSAVSITVNRTCEGIVDPDLEERFVELLDHYRGQKGALVPLLQGAQAIFGYLPPEVMARVAEACDEPLSKALGVATFYSQFRLKPHAKNTIRCCHGTACHVSGAHAHIRGDREASGDRGGREHRRHDVHDRGGALCRRLRDGTGGDDQRSRLRQADPGQGRAGGQGLPGRSRSSRGGDEADGGNGAGGDYPDAAAARAACESEAS